MGNIESKRDFIDVRDVAEGFLRLCDKNFSTFHESNIINLGSGITYSIRDLLGYVSDICNIDFTINQDPSKYRKVDNPVILASTAKLEEELDWKPEFLIKETLKLTWEDDEILPSLVN